MIKIPHLEITNRNHYEDTLIHLNDAKNRCKDKALKSEIQKNIDKCVDILDNFEDYEAKYLSQWDACKGKYWHVHCIKHNDYGDYTKERYMFIYDTIDENGTIWLQEIDPSDCYNGGLKDHNLHDEELWWYDTTLEEITKEEFEKAAHDSVNFVLARRLRRREERKNAHN